TPGGALHLRRRVAPPAARSTSDGTFHPGIIPPTSKMAPGQKSGDQALNQTSTKAPLTEYESERMEIMMQNSRVYPKAQEANQI
ncbi:unnamed protein product, partial [Urochloa humidicola]